MPNGLAAGNAVVGANQRMRVAVGMRQRQRINNNYSRAGQHQHKRRQIVGRRRFLQKDEREKRADKGGDGIIGAGFGRAQHILSFNIAENA